MATKKNEITEGKQSSERSPVQSYVVISEFRDATNFDKKYLVGEDVSHFDQERLDELVGNKLVELK